MRDSGFPDGKEEPTYITSEECAYLENISKHTYTHTHTHTHTQSEGSHVPR